MSRTIRDWSGYENKNWLVHSIDTYSKGSGKWLWLIECKACGNIKPRRTECLTRSVSCGCLNPEPANKGKGRATKQDKVTGINLIKKRWI